MSKEDIERDTPIAAAGKREAEAAAKAAKAAEAAAKAWQFSADQNLNRLKIEKQKNKTLQEELVTFRDDFVGHLDDIISQAERDDGVEVACKPTPDVVNFAPWVIDTAVLVPAGITFGPYSYDVRPLTAANYDIARHCVKCHAELLAMAKAALAESQEVREAELFGLSSDMDTALEAIIEKAEATP